MYPSDARAARERRVRAIRKALHEHVQQEGDYRGCSCKAMPPAHRSQPAWYVEHIADVLADL